MYKRFFFIFMVGLFLNPMNGFSQKTVTIETLLKEMVDRSERAKYPDPAFICKQFSSYDRASVSKDKPEWYANLDHTMFIRVEKNNGRREFVMMDAKGPGAIVRFWSTFAGMNSKTGILRVYIDENPTPVIEGNVLDILSGTAVAGAPLALGVPEEAPPERYGHNLYFPIPYALRCKVTYETDLLKDDDPGATKSPGEAVYYNINYRTYDPAVQVVSYSAQEMKKNKALLDKIQKQLKDKERGIEKMKLTFLSLNTALKPGESKSFTIHGMHAIQQLSMEIQASNRPQAMRSTILELSFDGEKTLWAPVGDFYGVGYMPLYAATWYTQVAKGGLMNAYWVMPFEKECVITLRNLGEQEVTVSNATAGYNRWSWDKRSMHFGGTWQHFPGIHPGLIDPAMDMNFATLQGKGVYMGDGVVIFNTINFWWGEGDEKVYVDGETFPSHIGTGTEDYYGYAWCRSETFTGHPFISQPSGAGNFTPDYSVNSRYRGLDGIPFTKSIVFDMELFPWPKRKINYTPIAYWYMFPGGQNRTAFNAESAKDKVAMDKTDIFSTKLQLTIEGEKMTIKKPMKGVLDFVARHVSRDYLSEGLQAYIRELEKGDRVEFEFECDFPGEYMMSAVMTIGPQMGVFNVYLNGQKIVSGLDLSFYKADMREIRLNKANLKSGANTFFIEVNALPEGLNKGGVGIDRLIFNVNK